MNEPKRLRNIKHTRPTTRNQSIYLESPARDIALALEANQASREIGPVAYDGASEIRVLGSECRGRCFEQPKVGLWAGQARTSAGNC